MWNSETKFRHQACTSSNFIHCTNSPIYLSLISERFMFRWKPCWHPYIPPKDWNVWDLQLGAHSMLRSYFSHSKPYPQCTRWQPLPWSCHPQSPPLRKPPKSHPSLELLKSTPIGYLRPGSHICQFLSCPPKDHPGVTLLCSLNPDLITQFDWLITLAMTDFH